MKNDLKFKKVELDWANGEWLSLEWINNVYYLFLFNETKEEKDMVALINKTAWKEQESGGGEGGGMKFEIYPKHLHKKTR